MKEIYIVLLNFDNGETHEDYQEYNFRSYFSTLEKAEEFFNKKVNKPYIGAYFLYKVPLDIAFEEGHELTPWDIKTLIKSSNWHNTKENIELYYKLTE